MFKPSLIGDSAHPDDFAEGTYRYFPLKRAGHPTRVVAKPLVVAFLRGMVVSMPLDFVRNWRGVRRLIERDFGNILTFAQMTNLLWKLYEWSLANGLPAELQVADQDDLVRQFTQPGPGDRTRKLGGIIQSEGWWSWLYPKIDWDWIARRIVKECQQHADRADIRAVEVNRGLPIQAIVALRAKELEHCKADDVRNAALRQQ